MTNFKVSTGLVKQTNRLLINSNKLNSVFYNIGNKFVLTSPSDMDTVKDILDRNFIRVYSI